MIDADGTQRHTLTIPKGNGGIERLIVGDNNILFPPGEIGNIRTINHISVTPFDKSKVKILSIVPKQKVSHAILPESASEARPERTERRTHLCGRGNEAT